MAAIGIIVMEGIVGCKLYIVVTAISSLCIGFLLGIAVLATVSNDSAKNTTISTPSHVVVQTPLSSSAFSIDDVSKYCISSGNACEYMKYSKGEDEYNYSEKDGIVTFNGIYGCAYFNIPLDDILVLSYKDSKQSPGIFVACSGTKFMHK